MPRRRRRSPAQMRRLALLAGGLLAAVLIGCLGLWWSLPDVRPLAKNPPRTTAFIELRKQEAAEARRRFVLRWSWRPLTQISPYLQDAVVLSEDARFWEHEGVDWDALEKAAEKNWRRRRIAMGGSTITQQLAKNLFLSPSKNPLRKLREFLIARRLESQLGKERLLELYLNVAEWGDGVFGAEAAARRWFGGSAGELTPAQAARLAVALPNPRQRAPSVPSPALDRKAARLIEGLAREGVIDAADREQALAELNQPLPPSTAARLQPPPPGSTPPLTTPPAEPLPASETSAESSSEPASEEPASEPAPPPAPAPAEPERTSAPPVPAGEPPAL